MLAFWGLRLCSPKDSLIAFSVLSFLDPRPGLRPYRGRLCSGVTVGYNIYANQRHPRGGGDPGFLAFPMNQSTITPEREGHGVHCCTTRVCCWTPFFKGVTNDSAIQRKKSAPTNSGKHFYDNHRDVIVLVGAGGECVHLIEDFIQEFLGGQIS